MELLLLCSIRGEAAHNAALGDSVQRRRCGRLLTEGKGPKWKLKLTPDTVGEIRRLRAGRPPKSMEAPDSTNGHR
jgi:hypothetical protein